MSCRIFPIALSGRETASLAASPVRWKKRRVPSNAAAVAGSASGRAASSPGDVAKGDRSDGAGADRGEEGDEGRSWIARSTFASNSS